VPLRSGDIEALSVSAGEQESDGKKEVEQALRVDAEIDNCIILLVSKPLGARSLRTKIERITSGRS
jgi:hypothetical protein